MKYLLMHRKQFYRLDRAFQIAFFQVTIVVFIEILNIINLLSVDNMVDLIFDYIALAVIADFDNIFY